MEDYFYFENTIYPHNKFWSVMIKQILPEGYNSAYNDEHDSTKQYKLIRRWGMIGTEGQLMEEEYSSVLQATSRKQKLIQEKIAKGYQAVM